MEEEGCMWRQKILRAARRQEEKKKPEAPARYEAKGKLRNCVRCLY